MVIHTLRTGYTKHWNIFGIYVDISKESEGMRENMRKNMRKIWLKIWGQDIPSTGMEGWRRLSGRSSRSQVPFLMLLSYLASTNKQTKVQGSIKLKLWLSSREDRWQQWWQKCQLWDIYDYNTCQWWDVYETVPAPHVVPGSTFSAWRQCKILSWKWCQCKKTTNVSYMLMTTAMLK